MTEPLKILIADDSKIDRQMLFNNLTEWGYQVYAAINGKEVIEMVDRVQPDLLILDGIMPEMDGYAVCEYLRDIEKNKVPVILITAYDKPEAVARAFAAGAEEYLTKPLHWDIFKYKLQRLFKNRNAEIALRKSEEKLRVSEERFRSFVENFPGIIYVKDKDSRALFLSKRFAGMLHEEMETIVGKNNNELFSPEVAHSMTVNDQEVLSLAPGEYQLVEQSFLDNGKRRWYDSYKFPILRNGEEPLIGGLKVESTERKHMDAQIKLQNKYLLALNEVTFQLLNRLDLDDVLAMVIKQATDIFGKSSGALYMLQENGLDVELKFAIGRDAQYIGAVYSKDGGVIGKVLATGKPLIIQNYQTWEGRRDLPQFKHFGVVIGLPLLSAKKVVGVCVILNEEGWEFTEEEKLLLKRFIGLSSIAYDNAFLYKQAQEEITERRIMEEKLRYVSMHDSLTGLYNRTYFAEEMKRIAGGHYSSVGIIVADVDGLKAVNDTFGHAFGDDLIIAAGELLKNSCRQSDVVARIGGDEFVVFLPEVQAKTIEEICQRIEDPMICYPVPSIGECLRLSIGWAVSNHQGRDIYEVFKEADANMYRDKMAGKAKK